MTPDPTSRAGRSARTWSRPSAGHGWSRPPTPWPATTSSSRCGSTSTSPGWSTATSARPTSRRPVDMEQLRTPARLRDDAIGPARSPRGRGRRSRTGATGSTRSSSPSRPRPAASPARPCRTSTTSRAASRTRRRATRTSSSRRPRHGSTELLPGRRATRGSARQRGTRRFVVPVDRLPGVVDWLVARFRDQAAADFGLPDGEDLRVSLVTGQPWSAYNWFDGGRRSRVDINTDLPVRASDLIGTGRPRDLPGPPPRARLEGSRPGRHAGPPRVLDPAHQHARVPDQRGPRRSGRPVRLTAARLGWTCSSRSTSGRVLQFAARSRGERARPPSVSVALDRRARSAGGDPRQRGDPSPRGRSIARRGRDVPARRRSLPGGSGGEALEFIEHPLWRTYVFVYAEGEALLRRWLEAVPEPERAARFGRLLHEQLTPAAVTVPG